MRFIDEFNKICNRFDEFEFVKTFQIIIIIITVLEIKI